MEAQKSLRSVFLISLAVFGACASRIMSERKLADIRGEVEAMLKAYHRDVKNSGLLAEFNYLDSSAKFKWIPPGYASPISYDSVAAILRRYAPLFTSVDNSFDSLRVVVINTDRASYAGTIRSITVDTTGRVSDVLLQESGVVIRRSTGWKIRNGSTKVLRRN